MQEIKKEESNIAVVEFKSISRGIYVTDEMLKAANVRLVFASSLCPGKYLTIVEGETSAIESSLKTADEIGGMHVYSSEVISSVSSKVIQAISGKLENESSNSIAIIESMQMASLIHSADQAVDAAPIEFIDFRLARGCGVNSFYVFTGELSAVEEASKTASQFLLDRGALVAFRVISGPDKEVFRWLKSPLCNC